MVEGPAHFVTVKKNFFVPLPPSQFCVFCFSVSVRVGLVDLNTPVFSAAMQNGPEPTLSASVCSMRRVRVGLVDLNQPLFKLSFHHIVVRKKKKGTVKKLSKKKGGDLELVSELVTE